MKFVVDASVAVKWVIEEDDTRAALALLEHDILSPSIWIAECANALWAINKRGKLSAAVVEDRLDNLLQAPVRTVATRDFVATALRLSLEFGHPVYDCLYLAVAREERALLVTADRRLAQAASRSPTFAGLVRLLEQGRDPATPLSP